MGANDEVRRLIQRLRYNPAFVRAETEDQPEGVELRSVYQKGMCTRSRIQSSPLDLTLHLSGLTS